jgi:hypothetical protein
MANLSAEEPDALMHARPGPWEPWRLTARATQPEVHNAPALGTPRAYNVHLLWEARPLDQRVPLCDTPLRRKMTRSELLLVKEEMAIRDTARRSLRAQVSEVIDMVGVSPW